MTAVNKIILVRKLSIFLQLCSSVLQRETIILNTFP